MRDGRRGFTLIEMAVVIAIIGVLALLVLTALSNSKRGAERASCLNNLRQVNLAIRMYSDESSDVSPTTKIPWIVYKELVKSYAGLHGPSSPQDKVFACPADTFYYRMIRGSNGYFNTWSTVFRPLHSQAYFDYSSYTFNGFNPHTNDNPQAAAWLGISGLKLSAIKEPAKTVLAAESPAFYPYSWHEPRQPIALHPGDEPMFLDAKDELSFVDGHASYSRMYYQETPGNLWSIFYNPPAGYDYKWSGD